MALIHQIVREAAKPPKRKLLTCPHCGHQFEPPKTDRRAYMRELMRKRRAEKKAVAGEGTHREPLTPGCGTRESAADESVGRQLVTGGL